jgi:hypothetical protein
LLFLPNQDPVTSKSLTGGSNGCGSTCQCLKVIALKLSDLNLFLPYQ